VPLSDDEYKIVQKLMADSDAMSVVDERNFRYFEGSQRLEHMGLAVPPELRRFELVLNWPRVVVETIENRQDVKAILRPGELVTDGALREGWEANNLDSDLTLLNQDQYVYGRGFMCVGSNDEDDEHPLITVESPREMTALVNPRHRRLDACLRLYADENAGRPTYATLYLPDKTQWLRRAANGRWVVEDQDDHRLGRVPVVMFLNRRRTGSWVGTSEMVDVIPLTDAAARILTNMQLAAETLAVPQRYALGVSKGDFVDKDGHPLPAWEAYFGRLFASANPEAKLGQLAGADLTGFHKTVDHLAQQASSLTGFPARYFGQFTTNPPAEGAIRADENQMVKRIERKNRNTGTGLGWVMGLYERFRTGEWVDANRIRFEWHDPGTPTFAQRADALQKLAGGVPIVSREGAWDELGWSPERKDQERAYFEREAQDPYLERLNAKDAAGGGSEPAPVGV
jgi:hypothetical protein